MNNFPAMTEEQRQALIARCKDRIAFHKASGNTGTFDAVTLEIVEIALAALTNDGQALARKVWSDLDRMASPEPFMRAAYESVMRNYTAPPAPVLRPIELPEALLPANHKSGEAFMAADSQGNYINREFTIKAIRAAGYEVKQ